MPKDQGLRIGWTLTTTEVIFLSSSISSTLLVVGAIDSTVISSSNAFASAAPLC